MSFWSELKRRNVFKVGAAYLIVAWLIAQVISIAFPAFHMPEWTVTFVMCLLIIGFFIAIILAWAYEVTPDGVKLTKKVPLADSITHATGRKLNYILAGLLVIAVGYIVIDKVFVPRESVDTDLASLEAEQAAPAMEVEEGPKTIAILPFENLSSDPEQEYFVDGLSEELLNCLAKINGLRVTSRTSSFAFKDTDKTLQEVASVLGVDHILEGSVRKAEDALRITAQLIRVKDDSHLWSNTYNRELKDIFAIQEDIAIAVADELKATLGIDGYLRQEGGTENVAAYELYLFAQGQWGGGHTEVASHSLETLDAALALDPEFALAWASKSFFQAWLSMFMPPDQAPDAQAGALKAAQKAVKLAPNSADAYYSLGVIKAIKGDFFGAESAYCKVQELAPDSMFIFDGYPVYLESVGYNKKANKLFESARKNDPLNQSFRGLYILSLGILGKTQEAEEEYAYGKAIFGDHWDWGDDMIMATRLGAGEMVSTDDVRYSDPIYETLQPHLSLPEEGLAELRRLFSNENDLSSTAAWCIGAWSAYFGDNELALASMEKSIDLNSSHFMYMWLPLMREVRQLPRFKEWVRDIGLVDYWNKFGWPDLCYPTENGGFECD